MGISQGPSLTAIISKRFTLYYILPAFEVSPPPKKNPPWASFPLAGCGYCGSKRTIIPPSPLQMMSLSGVSAELKGGGLSKVDLSTVHLQVSFRVGDDIFHAKSPPF